MMSLLPSPGEEKMIILDFSFYSLKREKLLLIIYRQHTLIMKERTRRKKKPLILGKVIF